MSIKGFFKKVFGQEDVEPSPFPNNSMFDGTPILAIQDIYGLTPKHLKRDFTGMTLGQKQREFTLMVAELIQYAYSQGYELTFGDAYRDPRLHGAVGVKAGYGSANSVHKERLAVDLNLFKGGVYQTSTEAHKPLGEFWESLGGSWGGRFSNPDGNHYSVENGGRK